MLILPVAESDRVLKKLSLEKCLLKETTTFQLDMSSSTGILRVAASPDGSQSVHFLIRNLQDFDGDSVTFSTGNTGSVDVLGDGDVIVVIGDGDDVEITASCKWF